MPTKKILDDQIKRTKNEFEREIEGLIGEKRFEAWKNFAFKGSMIQMAIAFILGAAFQKVVTAISSNLIMPVVGYILEFTGNDWREHTYSPIEGMVLETGQFAAAFVDFLLVSAILFYLFTKAKKIFAEDPEPKSKEIICHELIKCRFCKANIHYQAVRCPDCTSWLKGEHDELLAKEKTS